MGVLEEARGSISGREDWEQGKQIVLWSRGPKGDKEHAKKMEKRAQGGGEGEVRGEKAHRGRAAGRGGGRRAVTGRKGKSDEGTIAGRREGPGEEELGRVGERNGR